MVDTLLTLTIFLVIGVLIFAPIYVAVAVVRRLRRRGADEGD